MNLDQRLRALAGEAAVRPAGALALEAEGFTLTEIAYTLIPLVEFYEADLWWWDLFDFECLVADQRGLGGARALVAAVRPGSEGAFGLAYVGRKIFGAVNATIDYAALVQIAEGLGTTRDSGHVVGLMLQRQPLVKVLRDPDIPPSVLHAEVHRRLRLATVFDDLEGAAHGWRLPRACGAPKLRRLSPS